MSLREPLRALVQLPMSRRAVLWVGFGSLLALMIVNASNANRTLRRIEASNANIRRSFLERDDVLDRLRTDLYRSGIDVRDYLLNSDPQRADRRRVEVQRTQRGMWSALSAYRKNLPAPETAAVDELQRELSDYWTVVEPVLHWDAQTREDQGRAFVRQELLPRHQQMLRLAENIGKMDARQLGYGESTVAQVFADFRQQLTITAVLTILFGCVLAFLSISRIQGLERETEGRYREVVQAREELERLSERLVAAQEDERRRLSRELHDEVGQSMSALLVELGNLNAALPPGDASLHERVQSVRRLAESNVGAVRNMSLLLRPSMLDDLGLVPALKWQAREVSRRTGLKVKVAAEEVSDDLPDSYRTCIYRVVQEALHNATRHAKATQVRVTVRQEESQIRVAIQDDGAGFDPRLEKGLGILGMEERVRRLGGAFRLESEAGHGTVISILLPLAASARAVKTV
ncbi:MAG TPA: ATP-binding protein [Bryobacteraceae bacterium]|nr:ATP-binding protein [Bryobacteraceae bacterium]